MNSEEYERMYRLEDTYWWFVGRHHLVLTFLRQKYPGREDLRILDIGCGTGAMSSKLAAYGDVVSADFSPLALDFSKRRGLTALCAADAMKLPFREGAFDVVVALDILEHLPDDQAALVEFQRVLRPGGRVIATVPAYRSLWSGHDVALMHFRRYVSREVRERFTRARLHVEKLSYAMTLLYPIAWLVRRLGMIRKSKSPKASLVYVPGIANRLLVGLLETENAVIRRISLPFGLSVFCMAERSATVGDTARTLEKRDCAVPALLL